MQKLGLLSLRCKVCRDFKMSLTVKFVKNDKLPDFLETVYFAVGRCQIFFSVTGMKVL